MTRIQSPEAPQLLRLASELIRATELRSAVPPLRHRMPNMNLEDAYAIQNYQLQHYLNQGRILRGRKIGLTSLAMQQQLGVSSPDFGYFFEDMVYTDHAEIPVNRFISPKVEPELGFVLKRNLSGPGVTRDQAIASIDAVYPAMEIIDSRIENWDITLVDTVADNASCGAVVVGSSPLKIAVEELVNTKCTLLIEDIPIASGTGVDVMNDPVAPLVWLANTLGEKDVSLEAGHLILPGSFTAAHPVTAGTSATACFGFHGALTVDFT